ncbi:hypothetical protein EUX98_g6780 [Antrodiella citrinella]|uniref:Uncharacterized protein n=1 Tax=Antrodiella citrinella TaxID=2447956 RepID=A0A4S4MN53_9APHY|nr:hypothetical protein EUX98_g6780 [Antrodiella citrinella]
MVVLATRFALLAALTSVATFSSLSEVEGAVIQGRQPQMDGYNSYRRFGHSRRFSHPSTRTVHRRSKPTSTPPTLPLPTNAESKFKTEGAGGMKPGGTVQWKDERRWNPMDPLLQFGNILIGSNPPPKRDESASVIADNLRKRYSPKVEQSLEDDHHKRYSPEVADALHQVHHKRYSPEVADAIDRDQNKAADRAQQRQGGAGSGGGGSISSVEGVLSQPNSAVNGVPVSVANAVEGRVKREGMIYAKRAQPDGVAGHIDITSPMSGSTAPVKIATMFLEPNGGNGTYADGAPFILNASSTNSTQIFMVPLSATEPDASGAAPGDSTTSFDSSSTTNNSTAVPVTLQVRMFNSTSASMDSWCMTYDSEPTEPAPLTAEHCMDSPDAIAHKSQTFAYDPSNGSIRPMWSTNAQNGTETQAVQDASDEGDTDIDDSEGSSTSSGLQDPTTPDSSKMASVTSMSNARMDAESGDATRPPTLVHLFAAETNTSSPSANSTTLPANSKNVTMVFVPDAPEAATASVSATSPYASGTPSATAAAYDFSSSDYSSYAASATGTATILPYPSASATATPISAADYESASDYYSSTYSYSSSSASVTLSAADADFDNSSTSYTYPTVAPTLSSDYPSATSSASSVSAAGFGFAESTSTPSDSATVTLPTESTSTSDSGTATLPYTTESATPTASAAGAYDYTSAASSTATVSSASVSASTQTDVVGASVAALDATILPIPTSSETVTGSATTFVASSTVTGSATTFAASSTVTSSATTFVAATGSADPTSAVPTGSATTLSAAAFDVTSTPDPTWSSAASSSASATGLSAEAVPTGTSSSASGDPTPLLGVEVYDMNAPADADAAAVAASTTPSPSAVGAQAVDPTLVDPSASTTATATSSATPTMTPVSTEPYEWMFKEGTLRG